MTQLTQRSILNASKIFMSHCPSKNYNTIQAVWKRAILKVQGRTKVNFEHFEDFYVVNTVESYKLMQAISEELLFTPATHFTLN